LKSEKRGLKIIFEKSGIGETEYLEMKKKHQNSIKKDIRKIIKGIVKRDQKYRRGYRGNDLKKKLDSVDKINERALKRIFEKYGCPGKKLIGNSFIDGDYIQLSSVLRHMSDSIQENYFLPKMLEFIRKDGTCPPGIYASIVDQKRIRKGLIPKYQLSSKASKDDINKNRYEIGLAPL